MEKIKLNNCFFCMFIFPIPQDKNYFRKEKLSNFHKRSFMPSDWVKEIDIAITVSDKNGKFIEMNDKSVKTFANEGGAELIGSDILNCHNENSKNIIRDIKDSGRKNIYIVEKEGQRKLIYQSPWTKDGEPQGLIELSIVLPDEIEIKKRS